MTEITKHERSQEAPHPSQTTDQAENIKEESNEKSREEGRENGQVKAATEQGDLSSRDKVEVHGVIDNKSEGMADATKDDEKHDKEKEEMSKGENGSAAKEEKDDKPKEEKKDDKGKDAKEPKGGYDPTPVPAQTYQGYTVRFTFHKATNLPLADLNSLSSDPYLFAIMETDVPMRHKVDSPPTFRTKTLRKTTEPEWEQSWTVANIPASGFKLKVRVYDEDPGNHDDRLGNAHVHVHSLEGNAGFKEKHFEIQKRSGSWRAYGIRFCAVGLKLKKMRGELIISMEVLGKTEGRTGKLYTVGPNVWSRHFSPLIGRMVNKQEPKENDSNGRQAEKYDFEANKIQLTGPVPNELYHRFVEFKPFVHGMFSSMGPRGKTLHYLLRHQHNLIYSHDRATEYGQVDKPSSELALQFLKMTHFDQGSRVFTYVLMLDGQFRFTETGKEFGIDLLSKHTMHSNVTQYIACSGEFFIRRVRNSKDRDQPIDQQESHPDKDIGGGPPHEAPPEDPKLYELIIDNDSGTYRPKADLLHLLKEFLEKNFVGLKVIVMPCDSDKLQNLKKKQRERKKAEGDKRIYRQGSRSSSMSSSDLSSLDAAAAQQDDESGGSKGKNKLDSGKAWIKDPKTGVLNWAAKQA